MYESNLCIKCRPIFKALKSTSFFFFHFWLRNLNLSGWNNCSYWKVNVILCLYMFCLLLQWTKKWPKMQLPLQFAPQLLFFTLCNGKNWINGLSFFSSKFAEEMLVAPINVTSCFTNTTAEEWFSVKLHTK